MKEVGECVEIVCAGDSEDKIKEAAANFEAASTAMASMQQIWDIQIAKADKAFKKVESILK